MSFAANLRDILLRSVALHQLQVSARKLEKHYPRMAVFSFDFVSHNINLFGRYEDPELKLLEQIVKRNRQLGTALDIGANIGNHTLFLARLFDRVHAFEPNPLVLPLLEYNVRDQANVTVHAFGASSRDCERRAILPAANVGGGHVQATGVPDDAGGERLAFALKRLDGLKDLASNGSIDLIKLDVEGHELPALEGAAALLQAYRPLIALEQNADDVQDGSTAAIVFLQQLGYAFFYEVQTGTFLTPRWLPKIVRAPLKLIEAAWDDPYTKAKVKRVTRLSARSYPMLLASWTDLD